LLLYKAIAYSKRLIKISKISRLANVSRLVDEIESAVIVLRLGSHRLVTGENEESENKDGESQNSSTLFPSAAR
jgi:hypothetical protein